MTRAYTTHPYLYVGLEEQQKVLAKMGVGKSEPSYIMHVVANVLGLPYERVSANSSEYRKTNDVVEARYIAIGLTIRCNPKKTLTEIGKIFGRDHSSIIYARDKFNHFMKHDKIFKEKLNKVMQAI